ncbi:MAG: dephospho-CoA kinase [Bacillota bacterium]
MVLIGLTGGIASGKSTVSQLLAKLGVAVIDVDEIAREVVKLDSEVGEEIVDYFGEEVLLTKQQLDRKRLGKIIFNNPEAKEKLEEITHPVIITELKEQIANLESDGEEIIVVDIPLLFETDLTTLFDEIWVVYVSKSTQLERLIARDKISRQLAEKKIAAQMSLVKKKELADRVISNEGSKEELERKVINLLQQIKLQLK